ncbi:MAG TPA: UrcA family protein [Allosphingosinicella sp.]|nr:UrcA family protein [Allosphingosinicella sp.]
MKTILAFAALAAASAFSPALAQGPAADQATRHVRHADLDLTSAAGVRALDRRIAIAIASACGAASDVDLQGGNDVRRCRAEARERIAAERDRLIAARQTPATRLAAR